MRLSDHFDSSEFDCHCCGVGGEVMDPLLIELLEKVRAHFGQPVAVTSGFRCRDYNDAVGGRMKSQHLLGKAADIQVRGVPSAEVQKYLEGHEGGVGSYDKFTHVDVRGHRARWVG